MLPNVLHRTEADHIPVLAEEAREFLAAPGERRGRDLRSRRPRAPARGGSRGRGKLVAIDRDPGAKSYDRFKARAGVDVRFLRGDFALVLSQLAANGVKADAILLGPRISSMQIDRPERGFSYATDAPLDMRILTRPLSLRRRRSSPGTSASSSRSSGATERSDSQRPSRAPSSGDAGRRRSRAPASSSTSSSSRSDAGTLRRGHLRSVFQAPHRRQRRAGRPRRRRCPRRSRCCGPAAGSR